MWLLFEFALTSSFGLLFTLNRGLLVMFPLTNLGKNTVPGTRTLKAFKCRFERLVFPYANFRQPFSPLAVMPNNLTFNIVLSVLYNISEHMSIEKKEKNKKILEYYPTNTLLVG